MESFMRYFTYAFPGFLRQIFILILVPASLSIQTVCGQVSVDKTEFNGRESYALQNSHMRISMLTGGGYIAELRLLSAGGKESINPMYIPHYKTIDTHDYKPESHEGQYGVGRNAKLMAGYTGHYLCFPYFGGGVSSEEEALGYSTHGEAYTVKYSVEEKMEGNAAIITASAELPMTKYAISRSFTMLPGQPVVLVEEAIENLENFDRPYHWVQHITFGKPFIEYGKTRVDAPVSRIAFSSKKDDPANVNTVKWPMVSTAAGGSINAGVFDSDQGEGLYRAWLIDPEEQYTWFTMYHTERDLLVGYIFPASKNPWIGDWQENQRSQSFPRSGKTVAWGLELGNSPFGSGPSNIEQDKFFDTETFQWIGAGEEKKQSYLIFLLPIDESFMGVKELKLEDGAIVLIERETATPIRIANGLTAPK